MDIFVIGVLIMATLWTKSVLFPKPPEDKSVEEKFGEALGKYLKQGIKINVQIEKKDD